MEDHRAASPPPNFDLNDTNNTALIDAFCEITSSSKQEALFFLESHQWDLDSAVSTFLDNDSAPVASPIPPLTSQAVNSPSLSSSPPQSESPDYSPSQTESPSRSRSLSPVLSRPPHRLRSRDNKPSRNRIRGGVRTLADLNRSPDGGSGNDDDDEPQEYYTGGEKSAMLVQDPTKRYNVDAIFDQARNSGAVERPAGYLEPTSTSRSFPGTGRSVSGHTASSAPQPPALVNHTVTLWRNGFTVNDGPLRTFEDPANESFLESIKQSECPKELEPADRMTQVHLNLVRRGGNYELKKPQNSFRGMGRTLGSSSSGTNILDASEPNASASSLKTAPIPSLGLAVDSSSPTTSIQLRLADGTRMVSRFNLNHTIRDIRAFIDASRPGGARNYQLQSMGFPPKQLTDPDQTIVEAGIASSVVIQKF